MDPENKEECVLCCREIVIYATGVCDHPVCYECSTRMRVLCETNDCPICRSDMPMVVFTNKLSAYLEVMKQFSLINKQYNILFENENIKEAFNKLLLNSCPECPDILPNFEKLKEHVRRKHELHYCDLCSNSLKIFTFERRCYNRQDLARHKRKGDPDNTSHRGHPLCEFCDVRYVDFDELFRHLRREHYFCHFCDADGQHQYYRSYDHLKLHFRNKHFLCEEGDCVNERFIGAFRTEIDLKAHRATQHSKNKSRAEAKQERVLNFEFSYVPHIRPTGSSSPRGRRYAQQRRNNEEQNIQNQSKNQAEAEPLDTESTQEFPYLSEEAAGSSNSARKAPSETTISLQSFIRTPAPPPQPSRRNIMSVEDFPALSSSSTLPSTSATEYRKPDIQKSNYVPNGLAVKKHESESSRTENVKRNNQNVQSAAPKWISKKDSSRFEEDFPKLETKQSTSKDVKSSHNENHVASGTSAQMKFVNDGASKIPAQSKSINNNLHDSDEFVIIKSKSKKKKKSPVLYDDEEDDEKINGETNLENTKNYNYSFSNYTNFSNQEKKIRPNLPTRPPPPKESDTWEVPAASFRTDEFPPLENAKKPPPGISVKKSRAPPPGFTVNSNRNTSKPSWSSMTNIVENSMKSISVSEKNDESHNTAANYYKYQEPVNSEQRNNKLISTIQSVSGIPENFQKFKLVSRNFRCNDISASEYHSKCLEILREDGFLDIFPELISLLPDISKQQELLEVHNKYLYGLNSNIKRKNTFKSFKANVIPCKICNQVLLIGDSCNHECSLVDDT